MELLERDQYLDDFAVHYQSVKNGTGHTIFLMGEAGIGKTSLVNYFIKEIEGVALVLSGACDSLFTPRPLGPLFDIAGQIGENYVELLKSEKDRSIIFAALIERLSSFDRPVVLIFEDVHWADEATLDLIKFLARRIHRHRCLFLLTYRDNELRAGHPLETIFGELPAGHFSKVSIKHFSKETVDQLALQSGYGSGEKLYKLTGGNPFYVMEVLTSKTSEIPERVKDSILNVYRSKNQITQELWEFLSILPSGIELRIAKRIRSNCTMPLDHCLASGVIVLKSGYLSFKHELFRIAIEESLTPTYRSRLHKQMLQVLQTEPDSTQYLSQLVHHARFADERELVATLSPQAASKASVLGSHREAAKLYCLAVEYTDKQGSELAELYERHAYECYLIYDIATAIESQQRALEIWQKLKVRLKEGDTMRFLSRLWWYSACDHRKAMNLAKQSIEVLENGFPTRERAWAYSNFSQLLMLSDDFENALLWGNNAIDLASKMGEFEILSHALNTVGAVLMQKPNSEVEGESLLNRSLSIAIEHGYQEQVARGYVNLIACFVISKQYEKAMSAFERGFKYCEEHDLDFMSYYMLNYKAQLLFETGRWDDAESIASQLLNNQYHLLVKVGSLITMARIAMRRGKFREAEIFIQEAKAIAMPTHEAQRIIPVLTAALELSWISDSGIIPLHEIRDAENTLFSNKNNSWYYSILAYWMRKNGVGLSNPQPTDFAGPYGLEYLGQWKDAADAWKKIGCPYEEALALFEGDEKHQKEGVTILDSLGATATRNMLKSKLKLNGIKNIPRGLRESTRNNPAQLTDRQIEILVLLKEGATYKEIADKLFISPKTVEHHISAVLAKPNVNSRAKAVIEAEKLGILK